MSAHPLVRGKLGIPPLLSEWRWVSRKRSIDSFILGFHRWFSVMNAAPLGSVSDLFV
jgi:hypothetical protein